MLAAGARELAKSIAVTGKGTATRGAGSSSRPLIREITPAEETNRDLKPLTRGDLGLLRGGLLSDEMAARLTITDVDDGGDEGGEELDNQMLRRHTRGSSGVCGWILVRPSRRLLSFVSGVVGDETSVYVVPLYRYIA